MAIVWRCTVVPYGISGITQSLRFAPRCARAASPPVGDASPITSRATTRAPWCAPQSMSLLDLKSVQCAIGHRCLSQNKLLGCGVSAHLPRADTYEQKSGGCCALGRGGACVPLMLRHTTLAEGCLKPMKSSLSLLVRRPSFEAQCSFTRSCRSRRLACANLCRDAVASSLAFKNASFKSCREMPARPSCSSACRAACNHADISCSCNSPCPSTLE